MSAKWSYILGTTTIVLIVGGTVYAIVKSKQAEKAEEEAISLDEARDIVARRKSQLDEEDYEETVKFVQEIEEFDDEEFEEDEEESIINKRIIRLYSEDDEDEEDEEEDEEDEEYKEPSVFDYVVEPLKDFLYVETGVDPKEDKELRHEKNSDEAKHQFIRMELADWNHEHSIYRIMLQLFEFPFVPTNNGDEILRTQIIDYKMDFFGHGSKWCKEVSYADIILHYARAAEFNCGEFVGYWVEYFLSFVEIEWDSSSVEIDTILLRLNNHVYFNDERQTFGLFGLTRESMDQAIRTAGRSVERSVTYEIEFNEFLKSRL